MKSLLTLGIALMAVSSTAEDIRKPAPGFTLTDSKGATVKLSDYKGKVVLLDFWATWCGGCKVEIPWFQEFESALGGRKFAVVGVSMDEDGWTAVKPFVEKSRLTYRMLLGDGPMADGYAVSSMPATFLIDRKGRIAARYVGLVDKGDIERNIKTLLGRRK